MHLNSTANCFAFGWKNRENASRTFFINLTSQRTSKMRLNFIANRFVFGRTNREISPRTFSVKLAGRELPKCVWTSREIPSFLDANILKMRPEHFFNLQGKNLKNLSGLHGKQLRFCTQKSWKCAQNIFVNFGGGQLKKCIWTSRQTALFWDAKIGKLRPELLYKLCKRRISKMRLNFVCCDLRSSWKSWKYVPYIFEKILKLCFVNFSPVKEIVSKNSSADFQIICRLASKKSAEMPFFRLRGTLP